MLFIRGLLGFALAIVLTVFAVFNRHDVLFSFGPFASSFELPFYVVGLGFMGAGFVFGGLFVWLGAAPLRRTRRKQRKVIKALEKDLEKLSGAAVNANVPPEDFFPALPAENKSAI